MTDTDKVFMGTGSIIAVPAMSLIPEFENSLASYAYCIDATNFIPAGSADENIVRQDIQENCIDQ